MVVKEVPEGRQTLAHSVSCGKCRQHKVKVPAGTAEKQANSRVRKHNPAGVAKQQVTCLSVAPPELD